MIDYYLLRQMATISNMIFLTKIKTFFKEVWIEGKKVDWPTRQQTFRYTLIIIGISAAVAAFLGILDFGFLKLLDRIIF